MILDGKGSYCFYHLQSHFNLRALEPRIPSGSRTANVSNHKPYSALITSIVKWVSPSNLDKVFSNTLKFFIIGKGDMLF
jgi:hypothetical protein